MPHDLTADFIALQAALAGEFLLDCELGRGNDSDTPTNGARAVHG